ncbi:MAG: prepilin-type N-terminal cleavage/methylation domain-containing protein [Agathobacter sp.]|nr:prepilin-type N-terminal cleavage/methylation domain-containing protein [Agathobacter sp.]
MKLEKNQRGYTLVELIVVVALMGVLSSVGLLSYSLVTGRNIKSCAAELEGYIGKTKIQAMSRATATLRIFAAEDGIYVNLSTEGQDVRIGKRGLTVTYETRKGGATQTYTLNTNGSNALTLSFDRSSGSFLPLADGSQCSRITLPDGTRTMRIILIPETGKYYLE